MDTVKMTKGDLVVNINNSPESIAHACSMGYMPVDGKIEQPEHESRRGRPAKPDSHNSREEDSTPTIQEEE